MRKAFLVGALLRRATPGQGLFDWGALDAVIAVLLGLSVMAASAADSIPVLPEVRVERDRARTLSEGRLPTAFVTELRDTDRPLASLAELLITAAGVRVQQYGGLGAFSTVSLRGAPAGQVTVYLDGIALTSAAHGAVNLADLPAGSIERIEVYRGLAPLTLGPATPGGAINLVTGAAAGARHADVQRGSFDTWQARATTGLARGAWSARFHAGYQGSDGDFPFFDDNGTPFNAADDSTSARVNNRFDAATALATVAWAPRGFRVRLRQELFRKAQGVPGLGTSPALSAGHELARALSGIEVERPGTGAWPSVRLRGALDRERSRFSDRRGELGRGRQDRDDRLGFEEAALALGWGEQADAAIELAASLRHERAALADAADGHRDPPASTRRARGLAVVTRLAPLGGPLVLHAAHRWDVAEDARRWNATAGLPRSSDAVREWRTPQAGARLALGWGLEARANWTDARRNPGFEELFGSSGATVGNPELRAERGIQHDAGLAWRGRPPGMRAALEWARFHSRLEDLIVYVRSSPSTSRPQNVSRARLEGDEVALELSARGVRLSGAFAWQLARDDGGVPAWRGKRLPQRPERHGSASLHLPLPRARLRLDVDHLGENFLDPANRQRVAPRTLFGAALTLVPWGERLALGLHGRNLGDVRAADVGGYPLPGRTVFVSLETRFHAGEAAAP